MNCGYFGSDHRAIKLTLNVKRWVVKSNKADKPFVFENKWLIEDSFQRETKRIWEEARNKDTLPSKLNYCGERLKR